MDRLKKAERLIKIWLLVQQNPQRYTVDDLANTLEVTARTIYRDLIALESDLKVPLAAENGKLCVAEGHCLPPVRFTVPEALNIFLAARLMARYANRFDPGTTSTFIKLNSVMPESLREQVQRTVDWMATLPKDDRYFAVLSRLAGAWAERRRVRIVYRALDADEATERLIDPYFIEPAAAGHSSYVIAYCHRARDVRVFKVERIESIRETLDTYAIPAGFDANGYLGPAMGIVAAGEVKMVKLKVHPDLARIMEETVWHPSQTVERQKDGSAIMTLQVFDTHELRTWILGWGEKVEVLEPEELRGEVAATVGRMGEVYGERRRL